MVLDNKTISHVNVLLGESSECGFKFNPECDIDDCVLEQDTAVIAYLNGTCWGYKWVGVGVEMGTCWG